MSPATVVPSAPPFRSRALRARCRVLVGFVAITLAGCAGLGGPGEPPVDTVWRVVEIGGAPVPRLPDNRAPTLFLDSQTDMASGFTGCNRMTAGYVLAGEALDFGMLATTRMACEMAGAETEMAYAQALAGVARWRRRDGKLELLDEQGEVLMRLETTGRVDELPPS